MLWGRGSQCPPQGSGLPHSDILPLWLPLSPLAAILEALNPGFSALTSYLSFLEFNSPADGVTGVGHCSNEPTDPPWGRLKPLRCIFPPGPVGHFAGPQAHITVGARAGCLHRDMLFQPGAKYVLVFVL